MRSFRSMRFRLRAPRPCEPGQSGRRADGLLQNLIGPGLRKWVGGLLVASAFSGCTRQFWRQQADFDVYDAETEKLTDPRWAVPRIDVTADPRSRFYDPYNLDCAPLPPDDPTAHTLMHWVDGWEGYKGWHNFGDTISVENPQWLANLGLTIPNAVMPAAGVTYPQLPQLKNLTLQQANELALIHSRDYQTQLEIVYQAALAVTFQRFQFGVRYLGAFGEPNGSLLTTITPDGISANDNTNLSGAAGISQLLPTGAQYIIELSNNTLWFFSGGNQTQTASSLSFNLTQPLWLAAGRKVVLEGLTLSERQLLYALRNLARFRQQLFTDIVASSTTQSYLGLLQQQQIIINQVENLRRLEIQATKLIANAKRGQIVPSAPFLNANYDAVPVPDSLGLPGPLRGLFHIDRENDRLWWAPNTPITDEQAAQVLAISENAIYQRAANELIAAIRNWMPPNPNDPDAPTEPSAPFTDETGAAVPTPSELSTPTLLGVPADLQGLLRIDLADNRLRWRSNTPMTEEQAAQVMAISDDPIYQGAAESLVRQVRLEVNSLDVLQILTNYASAQSTLRSSERSYQDSMDAYKVQQLGLPPNIPITLDLALLKQFELIDPILRDLEQQVDLEFSEVYANAAPAEAVFNAAGIAESVYIPENVLSVAQQLGGLVRRIRGDALGLLENEMVQVNAVVPERLPTLEKEDQERLAGDVARDNRALARLTADMTTMQTISDQLIADLSAPRIDQATLEDRWQKIKELQEKATKAVQAMAVTQVGLRVELIELNPCRLTEEECIAYAIENRVDLMNARAVVMDARRQVEVAANALQAALALVASGSVGTSEQTNPFSFSRDHSQIQFGVRFKAPLDQITERNNYRQSLIVYQQAKRAYMLAEDSVKQQVRRGLRGVNVQRRNMETNRGAVRRAALQYDALNESNDDPAKAQQAVANPGANSGLQGQNVLQSLNAILQNTNNLVSTWIDYERSRLNLYRDMGMMVIGSDGLWDDPFYRKTNNEFSLPLEEEVPVPTPAPVGDPAPVDGGGFGDGGGPPALAPAVPPGQG